MAGKFPGKPMAAKPPRARKAPVADAPAPVVAPEPIVETAPLADTVASPVALAVAELPKTDAPVPAMKRAPVRRAAAKPAAPAIVAQPVPEPAPVAAAITETLAEAPVASTPKSQPDADTAPVAEHPAAAIAVEPQTVEPEPAPATAAQKEPVMDTATTTTIENTATKAETVFADMNSRTKTAIEKSQKLAEEMGEFHKGNLEAAVESAKIYAKGVEAMGQEAAEFGRRSFEQMTAALKSMAQVKTPAELMKLHADYVRQSFDAAVAEGSKNTEAMIKLAGDVAQPMSNRFALVAEKVKTAA